MRACVFLRAVLLSPTPNPDPLAGLTARQIEAVSLRVCGEGGRPVSFRSIGRRFGISSKSAFQLVARGLRRIEGNGWDLGELLSRFRLAA